MSGRCAECRHWEPNPGAHDSGYFEVLTDGNGYCAKAGDDGAPDIVAQYDGGEGAHEVELVTPPTFGCVLFAAKEEG